jgi:hypothetical protein
MPDQTGKPLIIYVPGLKPKPPTERYQRELWRCLLEGVSRLDSKAAQQLQESENAFEVIGWTTEFYREDRNIDLDLPAIEALLHQLHPSRRDIAEANAWKKRFMRWVFLLGDFLPFLIPRIADKNMQLTLRDLRRYARNIGGAGDWVREQLLLPLRAALRENRPVMIIAHSMGSIIAYDCLWLLGKESLPPVDVMITLGSPLGQKFVQRRLLGAALEESERFPSALRRWINVAAVGELTAIDRQFATDFGVMVELGLLESIEDHEIFNYFRSGDELNVHSEYGYLVNNVTAGLLRDWWQQARQ